MFQRSQADVACLSGLPMAKVSSIRLGTREDGFSLYFLDFRSPRFLNDVLIFLLQKGSSHGNGEYAREATFHGRQKTGCHYF